MAEKIMLCPLMQKPCVEDGEVIDGKICGCKFWVKVQGVHPQSGATIDHSDCAIAWSPILMIENTKINRETGAAIESLRNENIEVGKSMQSMIMQALLQRPTGAATPATPQSNVEILTDSSNQKKD